MKNRHTRVILAFDVFLVQRATLGSVPVSYHLDQSLLANTTSRQGAPLQLGNKFGALQKGSR